jgi:hypothetical protein
VPRGGALGAFAVALAVVLVATSLVGCLQGPEDGDGEPVSVTLRVEFGPEDPSIHAGQVTEWTPDGRGNWTLASLVNATDGRAVYVVRGLNASTTLGALLAGASAAGFEVGLHTESMGSFVDSIAGVDNGHDDHYWVYYVGDGSDRGEFGSVSSDRAGVSAGDVVTWVYQGNPVG